MPSHQVVLSSPTGRLRLIPQTSEYDEANSFLRVHPATLRYLGIFPITCTVEDARILRETRENDPNRLTFNIIAQTKSGEQFAGGTGILNFDNSNNSCEAGILVSPDFHGKGVATEALYVVLQHAFEERKFHRVTFETRFDNAPMCHWLENTAGARMEALKKEAWKERDGNYVDVRSYSILDWEWEATISDKLKKRIKTFQGVEWIGFAGSS